MKVITETIVSHTKRLEGRIMENYTIIVEGEKESQILEIANPYTMVTDLNSGKVPKGTLEALAANDDPDESAQEVRDKTDYQKWMDGTHPNIDTGFFQRGVNVLIVDDLHKFIIDTRCEYQTSHSIEVPCGYVFTAQCTFGEHERAFISPANMNPYSTAENFNNWLLEKGKKYGGLV